MMRIIAGQYRSRRLRCPDGFSTRPIPDRVKESLFGMLGLRVEGAKVVDLFAGSGAIGLEALSRGAASCLFVEQDKAAEEMLRGNIEALGCADRCTIARGDALGLSIPARCPRPVDLVFMDPPYPLVRQRVGWDRVRHQATALAALLADNGFLVLRTPWPFMIAEEQAPVVAGAIAPPVKKHKDRRREQERPRRTRFIDEDGDTMEELSKDEWEGKQEEQADADDAAEGLAPCAGVPGDLSIAGCAGPETHAYGTTAVHWYMRSKGG